MKNKAEFLKCGIIASLFVAIILMIVCTVMFQTKDKQNSTSIQDNTELSEFGNQEFECSGSCYCDEVERRSYITPTIGLRGILVASTSILAYRLAKLHFKEECQSKLEGCMSPDYIISSIEECNQVVDDDNHDVIEEEEKDGEKNRKSLFDFFRHCINAKHVKRKGWVVFGVEDSETITGHMHCTAMIAMMIPMEEGVDRTKILKMCLIHDVGESITGDFWTRTDITPEERNEMEEKAVLELSQSLPGIEGKEIYDLWLEFEKGETKEAKYANDLDRFDLLFQAFEYEKSDEGKDFEEIFTKYKDVIRTPEVKECVRELVEKRNKFFKEKLRE